MSRTWRDLKEIVMMHTDISRAFSHALSREAKYVGLPGGLWTSDNPVYGRLMMSLYGTRDAKVLMERGCTRGVANPCLFCPKERLFRIVVHGNHSLSGAAWVDEESDAYALCWEGGVTSRSQWSC